MPVTKSIQRSALTVSEGRKKERSNHQKVFDKKKRFSGNIHKMQERTCSRILVKLPVSNPDFFWAYCFLEVKDWIV